jgi:serine/threonine protein kinase
VALSPGDRLGRYEIIAPIGAGGMGQVYRARDTRLGRDVAVKISTEQFSSRFEREAQAIAALNHPHICALYDVGPDYLVMELVEGQPVTGPLPLPKALDYAGQILDALDAAHRSGITHRDLKPANILVTREGVKLLDFGLAKAGAPALEGSDQTVSAALTQRGEIVGTLQYMSPEQLQGQAVDPRSDLFSFGCVLYEMISGRRAFDGPNGASVIGAILEREPVRLAVAAPLDRVMTRALAKDPAERFQTARDLKTALLWAAEEPAASPTRSKATPRAWVPWAVAAAMSVAAIVPGVRWWLETPPALETSRFAIEPPPGTVFNYYITGSAVSPNGRSVVFRAGGNGGVPSLWLRPLDSLTARQLPGTGAADFPFWSPDSVSIGFYADGKLKKVNTVDGSSAVLCDVVAGAAGVGGAWGRDGTILFGDQRGLFLIPGTGGTPRPLISARQPRETGYGYPQFLPDGRRFLYFVGSDDAEVEGAYASSLDRPDDRTQVLRTSRKVIYASSLAGGPGRLLFVRERALIAQFFDLRTLKTTGDPTELVGDIALLSSLHTAAFWLSDSGALLFREGQALEQVKLNWVASDGRRLGEAGPQGPYSSLRMLPDGKRVALARRDPGDPSDIWTLDLDRHVLTRATTDPLTDSCPTWSPDGSQIAFSSSRSGSYQIYRKSSGGSGPEEQLTTTSPGKCPLDWSRDGRYLLYRETAGTTSDLWALPLDDRSHPIPIVRSSFDEADGQFAPSGKWIAYTNDETGQYEVYVKPFPPAENGRDGRSQISSLGGRAPRWRGDGAELFYMTLDGRKIVSVAVRATGTKIEFGPPQELFSASMPADMGESQYPYDVTGDGKRFLIEEPAFTQSSSPLTLVLNWQAGLKQK